MASCGRSFNLPNKSCHKASFLRVVYVDKECLVPSAGETCYSSTLAVALPFNFCSFGAVFIHVSCPLFIYLLICSHRAAVLR